MRCAKKVGVLWVVWGVERTSESGVTCDISTRAFKLVEGTLQMLLCSLRYTPVFATTLPQAVIPVLPWHCSRAGWMWVMCFSMFENNRLQYGHTGRPSAPALTSTVTAWSNSWPEAWSDTSLKVWMNVKRDYEMGVMYQ